MTSQYQPPVPRIVHNPYSYYYYCSEAQVSYTEAHLYEQGIMPLKDHSHQSSNRCREFGAGRGVFCRTSQGSKGVFVVRRAFDIDDRYSSYARRIERIVTTNNFKHTYSKHKCIKNECSMLYLHFFMFHCTTNMLYYLMIVSSSSFASSVRR